MAGLGLLLGGLAGGGKGLAASAQAEQETADRTKLETLRSNLEEQKALRIAEASRVATRQAGIQQGTDIDSAVTQAQNQRDADAINAANSGVEGGSNMSANDAAVLRNQPEARKAYGLLNPTRQSDLEDRANAAEKLGYMDAARETRGALQTEIANQRNKDIDASTNRRLDQQDARQDSLDKYNQRREDRLDRLANAQLSFQQARAGKEDARAEQMAEREQRNATVAAMKGAETDIKALQKEMADPMLAPEQKTVLQSQLDIARSDARRFRNALGGAGIEGGGAPDKPFNPADFRTGKPSAGGASKPGGTTVSNPLDNGSDAAPANDGRSRKTAEQLAEEDQRMARFNKPSRGTRDEIISQRQKDVADNFAGKLALITRGASKSDRNSVLDWLSENDGSFTPAQLKQVRDARRSAGF